jgi:hypothetical protein
MFTVTAVTRNGSGSGTTDIASTSEQRIINYSHLHVRITLLVEETV